ncbi:MAG: pilus assembly protein PilM [Bacteroidetes bacterium]|nr:pilus assembly protein PilM [Bacteroidota bacterium]
MKPVRYLGVSFFDNKLQCAEVEHGKKVTVTALAEVPVDVHLVGIGETNGDQDQILKVLNRELLNIIRRQKLLAEYVSFAVPTRSVFINVIPLDASLTTAEVPSYLQWEFSQYYPDKDPKEMIFDYHSLPAVSGEAHQTFIAGVPRALIKLLQKLAQSIRLKLCIVDIDQFSTEKTLLINYPEIADHDIALIGIRPGQVDGSLIHNGEMADYRLYKLEQNELPTKVIRDYLQYIKNKFSTTPEALLLHGTHFTQNYVTVLRNETGITQTVSLNSLRKLRKAETIPPQTLKENHRYASAIGVALRTK